ncbi:hypothetical protein TNCT_269911 [Trichonephila clavata]|uniref:Uncharacterized protein n=1 Tax=Trichonephila clavata TaxID=2740835 RepID=A0A8X6LZV7_TRICU|nr:hypothetical protein TNCT_269911 [Trichonephila clavata]
MSGINPLAPHCFHSFGSFQVWTCPSSCLLLLRNNLLRRGYGLDHLYVSGLSMTCGLLRGCLTLLLEMEMAGSSGPDLTFGVGLCSSRWTRTRPSLLDLTIVCYFPSGHLTCSWA